MALQVLDSATKDKLTEQIERLAMLLVTGDLSGSEADAESESPETLAHLQAAADAVYASARSAGFTEAVELVSDLKDSLAAAKNPKQDRAALESQLQTGITRLQAAIARTDVLGRPSSRKRPRP